MQRSKDARHLQSIGWPRRYAREHDRWIEPEHSRAQLVEYWTAAPRCLDLAFAIECDHSRAIWQPAKQVPVEHCDFGPLRHR
jgi:hypothetical protein